MTTLPILAIALQAAPGGGSAGLAIAIQIAAFALIFWFLLIRPQRKAAQRHREMLSSLQRNDEVVTDGGIIGTIVHLADDRVTIRTGENTRLVVARSKITRKLAEPAAEPKK
ncbi:MAG: preprotein translocase subunit YajC [Candidatus Cloacimonetes bacterium]|nr:preprotein translocase subunit YajC [Candidatus Cloacimonadota bacterium]